jgi:hypothetical protein
MSSRVAEYENVKRLEALFEEESGSEGSVPLVVINLDVKTTRNQVKPSRVHCIDDHNYHIKRFGAGRCPYCNAGSRPVPRDVIIHGLVKDGRI